MVCYWSGIDVKVMWLGMFLYTSISKISDQVLRCSFRKMYVSRELGLPKIVFLYKFCELFSIFVYLEASPLCRFGV